MSDEKSPETIAEVIQTPAVDLPNLSDLPDLADQAESRAADLAYSFPSGDLSAQTSELADPKLASGPDSKADGGLAAQAEATSPAEQSNGAGLGKELAPPTAAENSDAPAAEHDSTPMHHPEAATEADDASTPDLSVSATTHHPEAVLDTDGADEEHKGGAGTVTENNQADTDGVHEASADLAASVDAAKENRKDGTDEAVRVDGANKVPKTDTDGIAENGKGGAGQEAEDAEDEDDAGQEDHGGQSIFEHFRELRSRLMRIAIAIVLGFGICWFFHNELANIVYRPLVQALPDGGTKGSSIIFTGVAEGFLTHMKLSIVAGIFLMSPFIFYQIWAFIAPGLYDKEKHFVMPVAISSAICFIAGGSFCYFVVFPNAFRFFMTYSDGPFQAMPSMKEYFGFTMQLMLAFGIIFEMPLFCFFLAKLGIVTAAAMRRFRRYFIVIAFIIGAFLTPPDPLSQLLMAGPLILLYEFSIIIASLAGKKALKKRKDEDTDGEEAQDSDQQEKSAGTSE